VRYEVVTYGDAVLRKKAAPVERITPELRKLAKDMLETMYRYKGAGLAAQQIGRTEDLCVIDVSSRDAPDDPGVAPENPGIAMPMVLINPRIVDERGGQNAQEGCLSFPEIFVNLRRSEEVTVAFTTLTGEQTLVTARGLLARAVQHELDHLSGVLIVDRMSPVQKITNNGKLKRLKKETLAALRHPPAGKAPRE
jgi:peptide deformylase